MAALDDVEDWVACVEVEASRSEEGGAEVACPERVTATAVRSAEALDLAERVDGGAARALEPAFVAGARERLQEREAVARRSVAESVALLVPVGARLREMMSWIRNIRKDSSEPAQQQGAVIEYPLQRSGAV